MNEYNVSAGDKKAKKAQKIARCRGLKNFGWWLFGFLSSFLLVGGAAAIALCVIPAGTYFGEDKDKYLGEDAGKQSLLNLMLNYEKYGIEDFPIITDAITGAIENSPLGDYVTIDMDALNGIKFGQFTDNSVDLGELFTNAIHVTATINSLGLADQLGDLGSLSVMTQWDLVDGEVDPNAEGFNAKLYYYKVDEKPTYARAFTDDVPAQLVEGASAPYYLPALVETPILDMFAIFGDRLSTTTVTSLLSVFGEIPDDSLVAKIMGNKTLGDLGSISAADIDLADIIPVAGNEQIYKILCSGTGVDYDELVNGTAHLTVDQLENVNFENIKLSDVLDTSSNPKIFDILAEGTGIEKENITLNDLKNFDYSNIKLKAILSEPDAKLKNVLCEALNSTWDNVTVGMLSGDGFNLGNVKLETVLGDSNSNLTTILVEACGASSYSDLTIDSISNDFNIGNIKLQTVLSSDDAEQNKILKALYDKNPSVSELGSKMSEISLFDAFGESCFTTNASESIRGDKYVKNVDPSTGIVSYTASSSGTYYVSKTSGIWLLLCFNTSDVNASNGCAGTFTQADATMNTIENGSSASSAILDATLYQLIACGILEDGSSFVPNVTKRTLNDIITAGTTYIAMMP